MSKAGGDYSFGYVYEEATKETRRVPTRYLPAIAPAGAINSSARDMADADERLGLAAPETYQIVVRRDEAGRVAGITLKQPGAENAFRRVQNDRATGDTVLKLREAAFDVPVPEGAFRRKDGGK